MSLLFIHIDPYSYYILSKRVKIKYGLIHIKLLPSSQPNTTVENMLCWFVNFTSIFSYAFIKSFASLSVWLAA